MNLRPGSASSPAWAAFVEEMLAVARAGLVEMFLPQRELFAFCKRRRGERIVLEGESYRYTAITLLGLASQPAAAVSEILHGRTAADVCRRLVRDVERTENLGDVALTLWAANLLEIPERETASRRLLAMRPLEGAWYTVELAWALSGLCHAESLNREQRELQEGLAQKLIRALHPRGRIFPHRIGASDLLRGHVSCFADEVYPIQALSFYAAATGDRSAVQAASTAAHRICEQMGPAGQWWWHYDWRTGGVIEGYPVYSVHQNSMAPMALFALEDAGGGDFRAYIAKGLAWLRSSPELGGRCLVDPENRVIWRKVARREPGKLTRQVQAGMSRVHPALRAPAMERIFPARAIDWECRPYHLGWILYTWTPQRVRPELSANAQRGQSIDTRAVGVGSL